MSSSLQAPNASRGACLRCLRRSWLLGQLSGPLDYCARDRTRLIDLLALADDELLQAVAGRRAGELADRYKRFQVDEHEQARHARICRHRNGYPRGLCAAMAPPLLEVAGGVERLAKLAAAPVVAIVGSRAPSDYGMETARTLARGLTASGVTVSACLSDGIAVAAHAGALDTYGESIAVMGGGLDVSCPARRRSLYERVKSAGCAVSELQHDCSGRRWGQLAAERIVVGLAQLTVLVEADHTPGELAAAHITQTLGRPLGVIPGRVSSPLSAGPHALLRAGAELICGPSDVLELLHLPDDRPADARPPQQPMDATVTSGLPPELKETLARVGGGCDTPEKLMSLGRDPERVLLALSELELLGLIGRGDGGRYLPRQPLAALG
ncbi:MAG TPA: DNA-processing protein DprA [Solirubrobacteraceae bacterium]|jgi:DNA processing protein|nr:DNA-processing protein DprA [Solirubrobacteraceae bacterium]